MPTTCVSGRRWRKISSARSMTVELIFSWEWHHRHVVVAVVQPRLEHLHPACRTRRASRGGSAPRSCPSTSSRRPPLSTRCRWEIVARKGRRSREKGVRAGVGHPPRRYGASQRLRPAPPPARAPCTQPQRPGKALEPTLRDNSGVVGRGHGGGNQTLQRSDNWQLLGARGGHRAAAAQPQRRALHPDLLTAGPGGGAEPADAVAYERSPLLFMGFKLAIVGTGWRCSSRTASTARPSGRCAGRLASRAHQRLPPGLPGPRRRHRPGLTSGSVATCIPERLGRGSSASVCIGEGDR